MPAVDPSIPTPDVGTLLFIVRLVNGQVKIELPDDPSVTEGPTRFDASLIEDESSGMIGALPQNARVRVRSLVNAHLERLDMLNLQAERASEEVSARKRHTLRLRGALDTIEADHGN